MSIRCVCPNGHVLKVKDTLAGTSGLCPTCRARVKVPRPQTVPVSEDAVLEMLGRSGFIPLTDTATYSDMADTTPLPAIRERGTPKKSCYKCNQEIAAGTHICPYCRTYIANLSDF
jgi:hypothetical protein